MDSRFEVRLATKFALKMCGSTFSDQLTFLESSMPLHKSGDSSSTESATLRVSSTPSALFALQLKGLNASPILTERGRYPRRFEIEPTLLAAVNLVVMLSAEDLVDSSVMPCRFVLFASFFVPPSDGNLFFRIDIVSTRLGVVSISWDDDSETIALVGDSNNVGDIFGAVKDILLTIFLIIRGDDQLRSSLSRLDIENFEALGVTGTGDFELWQSNFSESVSRTRGGNVHTFHVQIQVVLLPSRSQRGTRPAAKVINCISMEPSTRSYIFRLWNTLITPRNDKLRAPFVVLLLRSANGNTAVRC